MSALELGQRVWCGGFVSKHGTVVGQSAEVNEAPTMIRVRLEDGRTLTLPRALIGSEISTAAVVDLAAYKDLQSEAEHAIRGKRRPKA